jgi:dipeptidase E
MKLLLLSNSTCPGESYLSWPLTYIADFTQNKPLKTLFIPYAGVTLEYDAYTAMVQKALPLLDIKGIHRCDSAQNALDNAEMVIAGGGNTFMLYKMLHEQSLMMPLRKRIESGMPFIGWSAGSNLACPGLYTTNDMPIVEPPSFTGLNVIPFQINPHFTDAVVQGHGGETRQQRIMEFLEANPTKVVLGLVEGALVEIQKNKTLLKGKGGSKLYRHGVEPITLEGASVLELQL